MLVSKFSKPTSTAPFFSLTNCLWFDQLWSVYSIFLSTILICVVDGFLLVVYYIINKLFISDMVYHIDDRLHKLDLKFVTFTNMIVVSNYWFLKILVFSIYFVTCLYTFIVYEFLTYAIRQRLWMIWPGDI